MPKSDLTIETVITGAEFKDFYENHWPKEWYVEEAYVYFEDARGNFSMNLEARHKLSDFGWAGWHGEKKPADGKEKKSIGELYLEIMGSKKTEVLVAFKIEAAPAR